MDRTETDSAPSAARGTTLVDVLDRILEVGTAVTGDVTLSVADVDLVRISLRLLVAAVDTADANPTVVPGDDRPAVDAARANRPATRPARPVTEAADPSAADRGPLPLRPARARRSIDVGPLEGATEVAPEQPLRIRTDPERVERGLAQLVMTVVGLLKDVMERQAERRFAAGTLTDDEVERLGETFVRLERRFAEILEQLEVDDDDLTLDLGPLGRLR